MVVDLGDHVAGLEAGVRGGGAVVDLLDLGAVGDLRPGAGGGVLDADAEPGVGRGLALDHLVDDRQDLVDRDRRSRGRSSRARPAGVDWSVAVWIAASMPTTSPERLTSAPPELPGLIAASVWIAG